MTGLGGGDVVEQHVGLAPSDLNHCIGTATNGVGGADADRGGPTGTGSLPPVRGGKPRRWIVAAAVVVLVALACGIGVGIGYAVHGPKAPSGSASSTTTTTGGAGASAGGGTLSTSAVKSLVAPELVNIDTVFAYQTARGAGTGMVVTSSGQVITNNHVIAGATSITATDLGNGKTYSVSVQGYDVADDVAVLQLQGASGLPTVTFSAASARLGQRVVAVGNAGGTGTPSAFAGSVTGLRQSITALSDLSGTTEHLTGLVETNAAIESGQSGGPLVNTNGKVLGMVTAASNTYTFSQGAAQGYAVPTATLRSVATEIGTGQTSTTVHVGATAFMGVRVTAVQGTGALVVDVLATSPAAVSGIRPGDVMIGMDGQPVSSPDTVASVLSTHQPGARIQVTLVGQAGAQRTVSVTLVAGPPA